MSDGAVLPPAGRGVFGPNARKVTPYDVRTSQRTLGKWARMSERAYASVTAERAPTDVTVRAIPQAVFDEYTRKMAHTFAWVNDGLCLSRATLGAARVNLATGTSPMADAVAGAVAYAPGPIYLGGPNGIAWSYHAATALLPPGAAEPVVVDYFLFDRPVPLKQWAERIGVKRNRIHLYNPAVNALRPSSGVIGINTYISGNRVRPGEYQSAAAGLGRSWGDIRGKRVSNAWQRPGVTADAL